MDLEIIILSKLSQTKTNIIWYHLYVKSKRMLQMKRKWKRKSAQSCLTVTPWTAVFQAPFVHGILHARILTWVVSPSSRESSQPRDQTQVSRIAGRFFTIWATRKAQEYWSGKPFPSPGDLPNPGIWTRGSWIAGGFFTSGATREALIYKTEINPQT